jgi:L,D-peptidoglycan transpeptidase YkuD (ErfK/YbiS/YcfS/YnhG family)
MTAGRTIASLAAAATVAGCIAVAVSMSNSAGDTRAADSVRPLSTSAPHTYPVPAVRTSAGGTSAAARSVPQAEAATTTAPRAKIKARSTGATSPSGTPTAASKTVSASKARTSSATTAAAAATKPKAKPAAKLATKPKKKGIALPLKYKTGKATRVITVRAVNRNRTTAHLQAWYKAPGGGWLKYGKGVRAHIGSQGMTSTPSEGASATPMGSFTLTQAFGRKADPGTPLPYFRTRPSDWWISESGRYYNTHQRCSSRCGFTRGAPNEHLYYETPYYNYAVVIDYNTRNAPGGVHQGAGSAFFLHVTDGYATAGCVAIPQKKLVTLMKWLRPKTHPRILIGSER